MGMKLIGGDFGKKLAAINKNHSAEVEKFLFDNGKKLLIATKLRTAVVTGHLRRNWKIRKKSGFVKSVLVFNNVEYAPHYEFGTDRFTGRYALTKSLNELEDKMPELINAFLKKTLGDLRI